MGPADARLGSIDFLLQDAKGTAYFIPCAHPIQTPYRDCVWMTGSLSRFFWQDLEYKEVDVTESCSMTESCQRLYKSKCT